MRYGLYGTGLAIAAGAAIASFQGAAAQSATSPTPYVIGGLQYRLSPDIPAEKVAAIRDAMDYAIAQTNALAAYSGTVQVIYDAGIASANATYRGRICFGRSISRRTALHELAHWLGSGTLGQWSGKVSGGRFTGAITDRRIKAFDGPDAVLHADAMHFWPYGLNHSGETTEYQRNVQLVSAQVADLLNTTDAASAVAGTRRLQNRASGRLLQVAFGSGANGGLAPAQGDYAPYGPQQWRVSYRDGLIALANADVGLAVTSSGRTQTALAQPNTADRRQDWEVAPTGEGGWFLIRNRAAGTCLGNGGDTGIGAAITLATCAAEPAQEWRWVR